MHQNHHRNNIYYYGYDGNPEFPIIKSPMTISTVKQMIEKQEKLMAALNSQKKVDQIMKALVFFDKTEKSDFVSIEYPFSIIDDNRYPQTCLRTRYLFSRKECETLFFGQSSEKQDRWSSSSSYSLQSGLNYDMLKYHEQCLSKAIVKIILNDKNVLKYICGCDDENFSFEKNLLLLDWDETLYFWDKRRPHLIEFLKFASKHFVIFIDTAAGSQKGRYINELNNMEPENEDDTKIKISGIFHLSRQKWLLNLIFKEWSKNCDLTKEKGTNLEFLLIDDNPQGFHSVQIPQFQGDENDNALKQLIPYLTKWNQYTNVDKIGTTSQFIKLHGRPKFE